MRRFLFLTGILFCACVGSGESNDSLKKAVIYYDPNEVPWGILKVIDTHGREFLKYRGLNKLTITDCDSLYSRSGRTCNSRHSFARGSALC